MEVAGYNDIVASVWSSDVKGTAMFVFNKKLKMLKQATEAWVSSQRTLREQLDDAHRELVNIRRNLVNSPNNMDLHLMLSMH